MNPLYEDAYTLELYNLYEEQGADEVLHITHDGVGTVCSVYVTPDGTRRYRSSEYTLDGEEDDEYLSYAYGYDTKDAHCYMGDRYRDESLWGEYFGEVFGFDVHCQNSACNVCERNLLTEDSRS